VSRAEFFDRYESHPLVRQLEGEGLVSLRGEKWAHHRKVLTPTFHMDNLKVIKFVTQNSLSLSLLLPFRLLHDPHTRIVQLQSLIPLIGKTVLDMVEKWTTLSPSEEVEIDVSEWFQGVTEDAITRTAFGRSYEDGKAVFQLQARQMVFAAEAFRKVLVPGYRYNSTTNATLFIHKLR